MSNQAADALGPVFQKGILKLMCQDDVFCTKAVEYLDHNYFSGELKWFYGIISGDKKTYNRAPTYTDLQNSIFKHHEKEHRNYQEILASIFDTHPSFERTTRELTGFIRANMFVSAAKKAETLFNSGNHQDSYELTFKELEKILKVDFEKERVIRFGDHEQLMEEAGRQATDAIPTGIHAIDEAMGGGMYPQTWTTFLGGSSTGKSMLNPSLAYFAALKKKRTFVTVHEDELAPTKLRFLSRFSSISYNKLTYGQSCLTDEERKRIKEADKMLAEYVVLRFMYSKEATIEKVCDATRLQIKEWPFQLFLCDYGQCLSSSALRSTENLRNIQEHVYHELKQLCLELNVAGAGGAQANRSGHSMAKAGADWLRGEHMSEAFGIFRKSSNVITINRSEADAMNNRVVFLLDKVRNGRSPVAVDCTSNYSACTTHFPHTDENGNLTQREIPVTEDRDIPNVEST